MTEEQKRRALELNGKVSWRKIAEGLGLPKSTVSDYLRTAARLQRGNGLRCIVIPDTQMKPGISTEYLRCIGEYIALKKPDVVVHIGDHADMPSLSVYDKGKAKAEGKRVTEDLAAAKEGMAALMEPINRERKTGWNPRMVLTLGNHEERIMRHVNANPELVGFLSYKSLGYEEWGWEVHDFLKPVEIEGVTFIHYYPNPMSGKPYGGSASNILLKVGTSVVQGHKQCLDVATRTLHNGLAQWSIVAGACYAHDEDYKGYTGNQHWRGLVVLNGLKDGSFDPLFVRLEYLLNRFGDK